jgi:hypothetical protein
MMQRKQRGMTLVSLFFIFGTIAFFSIVATKCLPLYLNQMKVARAVHAVAADPENANQDISYLHNRLERRWDIEDTKIISQKDIKVEPRKDGSRVLAYDYEARENLFYNIFIVIHFKGEEALRRVEQ